MVKKGSRDEGKPDVEKLGNTIKHPFATGKFYGTVKKDTEQNGEFMWPWLSEKAEDEAQGEAGMQDRTEAQGQAEASGGAQGKTEAGGGTAPAKAVAKAAAPAASTAAKTAPAEAAATVAEATASAETAPPVAPAAAKTAPAEAAAPTTPAAPAAAETKTETAPAPAATAAEAVLSAIDDASAAQNRKVGTEMSINHKTSIRTSGAEAYSAPPADGIPPADGAPAAVRMPPGRQDIAGTPDIPDKARSGAVDAAAELPGAGAGAQAYAPGLQGEAAPPRADMRQATARSKKSGYNIGPTVGLAALITMVIVLIAFLVSKPADEMQRPQADLGGTAQVAAEEPQTEDPAEGAAQGLADGGQENPADTGEAAGTEAVADGGLTGLWQDSVYTNSFLGIRFNMPEGWERKSDEVLNSPSTIPDGGKLDACLVVNNETGDNILIRLFDLGVTVDGTAIYETEFLRGMKEAGERDTAANAVFGDIFMTKVGDAQYWGIREVIADVATVYYLARRVESYMTIITIKTEGELDGVLANFS
jgi:hypothetical protein